MEESDQNHVKVYCDEEMGLYSIDRLARYYRPEDERVLLEYLFNCLKARCKVP